MGAGGTVTSTCVPLPGSDWMLMVPPAPRLIDRQIVNPRPLPFGLVVKKGSSTSRQVLWRDSRSTVGDDDHHPLVPMLGADSHPTVSTGCLAGVREQVEQHLFQLALSACDRGEVFGDVD